MQDLFPETILLESDAWITGAERAAAIDGDYRWSLSRTWDDALPRACWNCLNPSTADAKANDPSLIRMMRFSRSWGFGGCDLVNIYPYRSPHPKAMQSWLKYRDAPLGTVDEEKAMDVTRAILWNLVSVAQLNRQAALRVVAWGNGAEPGDVATHLKILLNAGVDRLHCLGLNSNGTPRHDTHRIPDDFQPILFATRENAVPTEPTNPERPTEHPTEQRNALPVTH